MYRNPQRAITSCCWWVDVFWFWFCVSLLILSLPWWWRCDKKYGVAAAIQLPRKGCSMEKCSRHGERLFVMTYATVLLFSRQCRSLRKVATSIILLRTQRYSSMLQLFWLQFYEDTTVHLGVSIVVVLIVPIVLIFILIVIVCHRSARFTSLCCQRSNLVM